MSNDGSERIVVGIDGSATGAVALDWAASEAERRGLPLTVVTVVAPLRLSYARAELPGWLRQATNQIQATMASRPSLTVRHVERSGTPGRTLTEASRGAELLVVGSRGANPVSRILLGSVSAFCATHAECPVVIVPGDRRLDRDAENTVRV